ncbi:hypothetical protein AGR6A_Lc50113 [Agrobacterium sp. NCPPB 925]|nr:hypothetical protein AGR6A_Lc50113 [Agrobacterium sp. NCPPB 925]
MRLRDELRPFATYFHNLTHTRMADVMTTAGLEFSERFSHVRILCRMGDGQSALKFPPAGKDFNLGGSRTWRRTRSVSGTTRMRRRPPDFMRRPFPIAR